MNAQVIAKMYSAFAPKIPGFTLNVDADGGRWIRLNLVREGTKGRDIIVWFTSVDPDEIAPLFARGGDGDNVPTARS